VSAGIRGLQIKLSPDDLIRQARAEVADLCQASSQNPEN
jgi:prolyl-tRNA editing enzyme YbaK/EbsC (Cys-tRNA(Pro) deacylase)